LVSMGLLALSLFVPEFYLTKSNSKIADDEVRCVLILKTTFRLVSEFSRFESFDII
jgi:hypothetical protein